MSTDLETRMALRGTQLTIVSERDVGDNYELCEELDSVEPVDRVHPNGISRFVAIVVHAAQERGHAKAMQRYGLGGGFRGGQLYVENWKGAPIALWDVVVNNINFLVIGPRTFKEHNNHIYLVERMIDNEIKSLGLNDVSTQLFKTHAPERDSATSFKNISMEERLEKLIQQSSEEEDRYTKERRKLLDASGRSVHQIQSPPRENLQQYEENRESPLTDTYDTYQNDGIWQVLETQFHVPQ